MLLDYGQAEKCLAVMVEKNATGTFFLIKQIIMLYCMISIIVSLHYHPDLIFNRKYPSFLSQMMISSGKLTLQTNLLLK